MSKFLFTVWPLTGHIHPNLAIATELKKLGHRVAFYTGSRARAMVEGAGFECFPLRKVDENLIEEMFLSPRGIQSASANPFRLRDRWRQCVLDSVPAQLEDLEEIVTSWQPGAIVCDPTMWAPFLILRENRRIPVAIFGLVPACHLSGRDGSYFIPIAIERIERIRDGLAEFLASLGKRLPRAVFQAYPLALTRIAQILRL